MPQGLPVTLHDDEITSMAEERFGAEPFVREYDGKYRECPGCWNLIHHSTHDHAARCVALRAMVTWEADAHRDPQPARLPGGAH